MAFQFSCPQGHVLSGEESLAGQACACPQCRTQFIVPAPPPGHLPPVRTGQVGPAVGGFPGQMPGPTEFPQVAPGQGSFDPFGGGGFAQPGGNPFAGGMPQTGAAMMAEGYDPLGGGLMIYHIPCPNDHELEVPADMLEQEVLCPQCGEQFRLRAKDSREEREIRRIEREAKEAHRAKLWLQWSVLIGVFVVIGVIVMIILTATT